MFNAFRYGLLALLISVLCVWCSSKDENTEPPSGSGGTSGTVAVAGSQAGAGGSGVGVADPQAVCGNGNVDEGSREECDDGNTDDTDGCTSLCEYSCHADADCQSD